MNWKDTLANNPNDYECLANSLKELIGLASLQPSDSYYLDSAYSLLTQEKSSNTILDSELGGSHSVGLFTEDLCKVLKQESIRLEEFLRYHEAFFIRQSIRSQLPHDFENLVQIFYLSLHLKFIKVDTIQELNLKEVIKLSFIENPDISRDLLLLQLLQNVCSSPLTNENKYEFVIFCFPYAFNKEVYIDLIISCVGMFERDVSIELLELCLQSCPNHLSAFTTYNQILIVNNLHDIAIQDAEKFLLKNQGNLINEIVATGLLSISLLSSGGEWQDAEIHFNRHISLILQVVDQKCFNIPRNPLSHIILSSFFTAYFRDSPRLNRTIQNRVSQFFQDNVRNQKLSSYLTFKEHQLTRVQSKKTKLKIGLLSSCLRTHSVGWLARFLVDYINREEFELYGYFVEYQGGANFLENWYVSKMDKVFRSNCEYWGDSFLVAEEIDRDQIDILIDLESLTNGLCCEIIALKPAPIQVTWLGWDAPGIPAIDYFIADPYVLPDNAQEYYSEKIWRLPQTYLAVDGFESTVATITREDYDIPSDSVVYFSAQVSKKRHPELVKLQMRILKQVPNSYFIIKGLGNQAAIQSFFYEMADLEQINSDRLKFIPFTKNENEHRANLSIADVVLDTYPYNGATTTMEVLWMGIPIVTRVGEQFVARNSYTMMTNAGISEGIAWTPEEYVQWGVRFGTEPDLRRDVAWKLRQSRKTSPLWNTRQFAREFETALKEMWEIHNG
jgi:predicted O-linked N-acetylglucosamine transferase (SPINDLY family)